MKIGVRPTYLEVHLSTLKNNLEAIRKHVAPARVMVILKANAYGHGIDGVAPFIAPLADYIGVALVEEGIQLRQMGIKTPILVMGGTLTEQLPLYVEHELTLAASSLELMLTAQDVAVARNKPLKVHLKIDTGMERIGVHEYEADSFIEKSFACSHLKIEGIFTHFANAESADLNHARLQLERFREVLSIYDKHNMPVPECIHTANSAAILSLPESHFNMVRPGILFYGVPPDRRLKGIVSVNPALVWKSRVVFSKITQPGRAVSYGSLWKPQGPARIITIPCGYADGYFRCMTNRAQVVISGKKYPQVGRICMDQLMVNVGDDEIHGGEDVILLGEDILAEDLADWAGTNEYEVLTNISARVPRVHLID